MLMFFEEKVSNKEKLKIQWLFAVVLEVLSNGRMLSVRSVDSPCSLIESRSFLGISLLKYMRLTNYLTHCPHFKHYLFHGLKLLISSADGNIPWKQIALSSIVSQAGGF